MTRSGAKNDPGLLYPLSKDDALKRAPRGFENVDDPEIAAAMRLRNFFCLRPVSEAMIRKPTLIDDFRAFASDSLPLLRWDWDALAETR